MTTAKIIAAALEQYRAECIEEAVKHAESNLKRIKDRLAAANWDLEGLFPNAAHNKQQYQQRNFYRSITRVRNGKLEMNPTMTIKYVKDARGAANEQFDLYVGKMVQKAGDDVVSAEAYGKIIWDYSVLTVTHANGEVVKWKTQQIWNVSPLGKVFPQWPTTKIKEPKPKVKKAKAKAKVKKETKEYVVTMRFQFPAHDEKDGIEFNVWATSKTDANAKAKSQAKQDGHHKTQCGRISYKAVLKG